MKKTLLLSYLSCLGLVAFSQVEIPKKMLKGIDIKEDEFTNSKTYHSKGSCLSIVEQNGEYTLYIGFSCINWDTPINLKKIYILVNGENTIIENDGVNFLHKKEARRVLKQQSTGKVGAGYKPAVYGERYAYIDTWKTEANEHMGLINDMISTNSCKVKFEGSNGDIILDMSKGDISNSKSILDLYTFFTSE